MAHRLAHARALLPLLLLLAGLHAVTVALIRPLYQVSDEVNYLASAQRVALAETTDPSLLACISPPDGRMPLDQVVGGKALFHRLAGGALTLACRMGAGDAAPVVIRLAFALSLVVVTWCGWQGASLLFGGTLVPALTALTLATQPVLAKYAAGVTPDSIANAFAALAIVQMLRWIVHGPSAGRLGAVIITTALAAAMKDSALVFVPVNGLFLAVSALRRGHRPIRHGWARVVVLALVAATVVLLGFVTRTSQQIGPGVAEALASPLRFASLVLDDTLRQLPGFFTSAWTSLGGFGGTSASLPATALALVLALWIWAGVGLVAAGREEAPLPAGVLPYLVVLGLACLLQAPTRLVLLAMTDQHQGRWLFPFAVPVALCLARGLAAAGGQRIWPLVTLATLTIAGSATAAVAQWHVTSPDWTLDRVHLFLHSTGGFNIGVARTAAQVAAAWSTVPPLAPLLALVCCTICGGLLLLQRPDDSTRHGHDSHHR